jgi:hypothetical protein
MGRYISFISRIIPETCACGRTFRRMERVMGRSDDMLIIRGVNVYPSQIEQVLLGIENVAPHYQVVLSKRGSMDYVEVHVEVAPGFAFDEVKELEALRKRVTAEIASVLAFGQVPMGIVPAGSGNGLARELGLPFEPAAALEKAVGGSARAIDVGEIEQRLFVNVAGIGIDAHVAARFNAVGNLRRGPRTYVAMTAAALTNYRAKTYDIAVAGERITKKALLIVLANGTEFGNRILIARGARVDDGLLDMVVVEERSRLATISRVPWLLSLSIHRVPVWST